MILKQKQGLNTKEFELTDKIIRIKSTSAFGEMKEWSVNLEFLGDSKFYESHSRKGPKLLALILSAFIIFVTIAFLVDDDKAQNVWVLLGVYALFGGMIALLLFSPMRNELHLVGGANQISFFMNSPSKLEVETFVEEVVQRTKRILLDKYGRIDPDLPEDTQMNQLNYLKNRDLISEELYEQLKFDYKTQKMIKGM